MCRITIGKIPKMHNTKSGGGTLTRNAPAILFHCCRLALNCYVEVVGENKFISLSLFSSFLPPSNFKNEKAKEKNCIQQLDI